MQEIWKVRSFSHWFFHDFFMNFFHFEKNSGFSISCTSHRRGDMYRNFTPSDPIFPLWARAPTARAVPVELCMFFITFSTVFLLILLGTWVRFAWTWKNILICQVFFDRGCTVKTMCSIDAYDENLKFWKPAKSEFWGGPKLDLTHWSETPPLLVPARAGEGVVNFCNRRRRPGPCPSRRWLSGHVCSGPEPHVVALHVFLF